MLIARAPFCVLTAGKHILTFQLDHSVKELRLLTIGIGIAIGFRHRDRLGHSTYGKYPIRGCEKAERGWKVFGPGGSIPIPNPDGDPDFFWKYRIYTLDEH